MEVLLKRWNQCKSRANKRHDRPEETAGQAYGVIRREKMRILIAFLLLILTGCNNHTYKYFEFASKEIHILNGEVSARLNGDFVLVKDGKIKETHKGNPYELIIYFETNSPSARAVKIEGVSLISAEGKVVAKVDEGTLETELTSSKSYLSHYSIKGITTKHIPHFLRFKVYVRGENGSNYTEIEIYFIPKFREERSNDFIDKLMSV